MLLKKHKNKLFYTSKNKENKQKLKDKWFNKWIKIEGMILEATLFLLKEELIHRQSLS